MEAPKSKTIEKIEEMMFGVHLVPPMASSLFGIGVPWVPLQGPTSASSDTPKQDGVGDREPTVLLLPLTVLQSTDVVAD